MFSSLLYAVRYGLVNQTMSFCVQRTKARYVWYNSMEMTTQIRRSIIWVLLAILLAGERTSGGEMGDGKKAVFAAGCFWGVEEVFRKVDGVRDTEVGYMGGVTENPSYEEVCSGRTGHAEAVKVTYDPSVVSYEDLLGVFWKSHDPTQGNRQGPDVGTQYRSVIFYYDDAQKNAASVSLDKLNATPLYGGKITTVIEPVSVFYPAEEYHQRYYEKRGQGGCHI